MTVRDVMVPFDDRTVPSRAKIQTVLTLMRASALRGVPVVDLGKLVGVLSHTDLRDMLALETPPETVLVKDLMTAHPVSVSPDDNLNDILFLFTSYKFTWLPVTEDDYFVGIINQHDVLVALFSTARGEKGENLEAGAVDESNDDSKTASESAAGIAD